MLRLLRGSIERSSPRLGPRIERVYRCTEGLSERREFVAVVATLADQLGLPQFFEALVQHAGRQTIATT